MFPLLQTGSGVKAVAGGRRMGREEIIGSDFPGKTILLRNSERNQSRLHYFTKCPLDACEVS